VVAACSPCNLKKGGMMPKQAGMLPRVWPFEPSVTDLQKSGRSFPPNHLHESWNDFLYWDAELEP
jgi:5-methylcytosine-specific restriction endonuclease McrA